MRRWSSGPNLAMNPASCDSASTVLRGAFLAALIGCALAFDASGPRRRIARVDICPGADTRSKADGDALVGGDFICVRTADFVGREFEDRSGNCIRRVAREDRHRV